MPPAARRRSRQRRPAQDSLRPGWMLNSILFCVLLAAIGGCYVWLGARKKDQADQILAMHREIDLLDRQIREKELQISRRLAPEELRERTRKAGLELKPIAIGPRGNLYTLPEPVLPQEGIPSGTVAGGPDRSKSPALAGTRQP